MSHLPGQSVYRTHAVTQWLEGVQTNAKHYTTIIPQPCLDTVFAVPMIYEFKYRQHMKKMKPALIKRKRTDISQICYPDWRSTKKVDEATRKKVCGW